MPQFSAGSEFGPVIDQPMRQRLLRGLFDNYYADQAGKSVVFDSNRMWSGKLPAILDLFPAAKVIACVRNVAWIMDSLERLYRANPYENTKLFLDETERNTVYSRVDTLAQRNRVRPVVSWAERRTVLPPDLYEKYAELSFWRDGKGSAANVIREKAE